MTHKIIQKYGSDTGGIDRLVTKTRKQKNSPGTDSDLLIFIVLLHARFTTAVPLNRRMNKTHNNSQNNIPEYSGN